MREIVFDTETTGLNPRGGDRLVEIGCVELLNRCETGRTFHAWFNPDRDMPAEAEAIHGLSARFLADKPRFHEAVQDLLAFIGDAPLIAHNATFDFGFLNAELDQCGHPVVCMTRMVDTLTIAKTRHPGAKLSLDALCSRYGIDRSHRVKHGALLDAQLLAQLYVELMGGRQIGFMLPAEESGDVTAPVGITDVIPMTVRPMRSFSASPEELARHAAFVAKLVDPLWSTVDAQG
ncbi:DNA polymerase III subunit epsilon [Sphingomonas prati]|uniref:DNA polymerase III subunit epsilon n=1 Tax=Sphingomonas prati TaxID=1843237 RepID=A0A7W9BRJ4_9SPHN|nr:DNA polymerase III subunit epsilon [Sphingomonas prati]MBB5728834.1 DNA polymerase-3 subunit epsilon [Sphingomonas prati]GGE87156.1 DNA polymerase III subunit epsilon [Sphingomonas prati]